MELLQNSGFVATVIFVINIIFNLGFYKARLKQFPDKEEVLKLMKIQAEEIEREIDKRMKGHCPFEETFTDLRSRLDEHDVWIRSHEKYAAEANEANHLLLQELVINTKRICETIDIKYLKQNGNGI